MMVNKAATLKVIRRQQENLEWIAKDMARLRNEHGGRYIAVRSRKVIDVDKDFAALLGRVRKLKDSDSVTIEHITELEYLWLL